jgi:hypothetical protein
MGCEIASAIPTSKQPTLLHFVKSDMQSDIRRIFGVTLGASAFHENAGNVEASVRFAHFVSTQTSCEALEAAHLIHEGPADQRKRRGRRLSFAVFSPVRCVSATGITACSQSPPL